MKRTCLAWMLAVALLGDRALSAPKEPGAFQVVVHPENSLTKLSSKELGSIFLGKKVFWEDQLRIVPVLLENEAPATQTFLKEVLRLGSDQYLLHWKRKVFSGGGAAPRQFRNAKELLEYVEKTPGAIGIVETSDTSQNLKVVQLER